jgi:hypothetical protein
MIEGNKKYAFKRILSGSDELAPALFGAVLHVFPILGPLLSPLESPATANTNFWFKTVLGLWGWTHGSSLIRPKRHVLNNPSEVHGHKQHYNSTDSVNPLELRSVDPADLVLLTLTTKHR